MPLEACDDQLCAGPRAQRSPHVAARRRPHRPRHARHACVRLATSEQRLSAVSRLSLGCLSAVSRQSLGYASPEATIWIGSRTKCTSRLRGERASRASQSSRSYK